MRNWELRLTIFKNLNMAFESDIITNLKSLKWKLPPIGLLLAGVFFTVLTIFIKNSDGAWINQSSDIVVYPIISAKFDSDVKIFRDTIKESIRQNFKLYANDNSEQQLSDLNITGSYQKFNIYNDSDKITRPIIKIGTRDNAIEIALEGFTDSITLTSELLGELSGIKLIGNIQKISFADPQIDKLRQLSNQHNNGKVKFANTYLDKNNHKVIDYEMINFVGSLFSGAFKYNKLISDLNSGASFNNKEIERGVDFAEFSFKRSAQTHNSWKNKEAISYALFIISNIEIIKLLKENQINPESIRLVIDILKKSLKLNQIRSKNQQLTFAIRSNLVALKIIQGYLSFDRKAVKYGTEFLAKYRKKVTDPVILKNIKSNLSLIKN